MNCLILNGNPKPSGFDDYLSRFALAVEEKGHSAQRFDLRDMNLKYCTGCWSCWWASPGLCALKDDMAGLYPRLVAADLIVWASPLVLGNASALLKKAQDRFIPLIHPYIVVSDGECHHRRRYTHNADIAFITEPGPEDGAADLEMVHRLFERFSRNTRTKLRLFATTAKAPKEAADEALAG